MTPPLLVSPSLSLRLYASLPNAAALPEAVVAVLTNPRNEVLCVSRGPGSSEWALLGGKVDPGETPESALVREGHEESGLALANLRFVYADVTQGTDGMRFYTRAFTADWTGTPRGSEEGDVAWLPWNRVLAGPFGLFALKVLSVLTTR